MDIPEQEQALLLQLVADARVTAYCAAAAECLLLYEHIVCLPDEIELMWKSRWGIAKAVYLWNRYFSLVAITLNTAVILREMDSSVSCKNWLRVQGTTSTLIIATVDFVLMLRVWILYGRPWLLVWLFSFVGVAEVTAMIATDFLVYAKMTDFVHLGPILTGCYATYVPRFLLIFAAAPLVVTSTMFILTLYKCVTALNSRITSDDPEDDAEAGAPPPAAAIALWRLFLRDGAVWFFVAFVASFGAILVWTIGRDTLKQLVVVPGLVIYSTAASRTLLNIKALMARESAQNLRHQRHHVHLRLHDDSDDRSHVHPWRDPESAHTDQEMGAKGKERESIIIHSPVSSTSASEWESGSGRASGSDIAFAPTHWRAGSA